ncbi:MAG: hypothetical protein OXE94_06115 [Aestuariivita sp.]|nr:hypothetical protein [Aestuariivita sp.]
MGYRSKTAVSSQVVDDLGLIPLYPETVETVAGSFETHAYLINIYLPNGAAVLGLEVTRNTLKGCDVLVGMDIISMGDFAVTQKMGSSIMTCQILSSHSTDYVKEINAENKSASRRSKRKNPLKRLR